MDQLISGNSLKLELMLGQVVFSAPELGICLVQPMTAEVSRNADTAVTGGVGEYSNAFVKDNTVYRINEHVLYARVETGGTYSTTPMSSAIILCRAPVQLAEYTDCYEPREEVESEYRKFYDLIRQLTDRESTEDAPIAEFLDRTWFDAKMGGDKIFEGKNVLLRISDEVIQILGRRCGIHVNSVDSSVEIHGVTLAKSALGESERSVVVNDSILKIKRSSGSTKHTLDTENNKELFTDETLSGDLAYGEVRTRYDKDRIPVFQEQLRNDGGYRAKSITGFLFEKTENIDSYTPEYDSAILHDDKLKKSSDIKEPREPFDRVTNSKDWTPAVRVGEDTSFTRETGDINDNTKRVPTKDTEGGDIDTYKGKASWGMLPNGGFIIRDAWGSEIRMSDGDIQIAAAGNVQFLAGSDLIGIAGGVAMVHAKQGVELGSSEGNIDAAAKGAINLHGSTAVDVYSGRTCTILSEDKLTLRSIRSTSVSGQDIAVSGLNDVIVSGAKAYVVGNYDAVLASTSAVVRCDAGLSLANRNVVVFGSLATSTGAVKLGKIGDVNIASSESNGDISVVGNVSVDKAIRVNDSLSVSGSGSFGRLATADASKVEGGYGFGSRLRSAPSKVSVNKYSPSAEPKLKEAQTLWESIKSITKDTIMSTMFNIPVIFVALVKPLFCGKTPNKTKIGKPVTVDIAKKERYIYPGEKFWNTSGVLTIKNSTTAKNILYEELDTKPTIGASDLQLHD